MPITKVKHEFVKPVRKREAMIITHLYRQWSLPWSRTDSLLRHHSCCNRHTYGNKGEAFAFVWHQHRPIRICHMGGSLTVSYLLHIVKEQWYRQWSLPWCRTDNLLHHHSCCNRHMCRRARKIDVVVVKLFPSIHPSHHPSMDGIAWPIHPSVPSSIHGWHHTGKKTLAKINKPPFYACVTV
jgi:hypothetical protein